MPEVQRCEEHGSLVDNVTGRCATVSVLADVGLERRSQAKRHGLNLENESGTGRDVTWARPLFGHVNQSADLLEGALRKAYESTEARGGRVTWLQIALEEFAEVAKESDPTRLREELVQLAAVCVSWAEKLSDPESVICSSAS